MAEPQPSSSLPSDEEEPLLIPPLPNDVALQCLARVPHSHHPFLSLVSKSWHSTLLSPHFHSTRRALRSTQPILLLNLRLFSPNHHPSFSFQWFSLDPSSRTFSILAPIKPCPSQPIGASFVSLDTRLYVIGGSVNEAPTRNVWVYDHVSGKWEVGPRMRVGREFAASGVVDGRIYVLGGCVVDTWARSVNWAEVYDPSLNEWAPVESPVEVREKWMHASAVVDGRIYAMADRGGVVFDPRKREWGPVSMELDMGWRGRAAVVDGVLYCYDYLGKIRGFDMGDSVWKELRGVDKGLPKFLCGATMANVGERLFVLWEGKGKGNNGSGSGSGNRKEMEVRCAEIVVRMDESAELWGSIVWSEVILVVPSSSSIVHCLDVHL